MLAIFCGEFKGYRLFTATTACFDLFVQVVLKGSNRRANRGFSYCVANGLCRQIQVICSIGRVLLFRLFRCAFGTLLLCGFMKGFVEIDSRYKLGRTLP